MGTGVLAGFVFEHALEAEHGDDHDDVDDPAVLVQRVVNAVVATSNSVAALMHQSVPDVRQALFPERQREPN
jgi:hypothetical protein